MTDILSDESIMKNIKGGNLTGMTVIFERYHLWLFNFFIRMGVARDVSQDFIFGELDMKTLSMTFRLSYTIKPELTIEYYGQPFISAGKYSNFSRITSFDAPRFSDRYHIFPQDDISYNAGGNYYEIDENNDNTADFTISNPDFNFRQFRSNLVVRWEYLPGSTIYLVWSQGRTSTAESGVYSFGPDMKDLFNIKPHNIFLLKFSYWFML